MLLCINISLMGHEACWRQSNWGQTQGDENHHLLSKLKLFCCHLLALIHLWLFTQCIHSLATILDTPARSAMWISQRTLCSAWTVICSSLLKWMLEINSSFFVTLCSKYGVWTVQHDGIPPSFTPVYCPVRFLVRPRAAHSFYCLRLTSVIGALQCRSTAE